MGSLLRHFMRELNTKLEDGKLGEYLVQFVNLWVALNCDILRGGSVTLEKCLRSQLSLSSHPDKYLGRFIQWSRSQASSIDGYVMSEKIIVEQATESTQSPLSASPGDNRPIIEQLEPHKISSEEA